MSPQGDDGVDGFLGWVVYLGFSLRCNVALIPSFLSGVILFFASIESSSGLGYTRTGLML
jgi:hypothetical protein